MIPWKERQKYVSNIGVVFGQRSQLWWDIPAEDTFLLLKDIYDIPDKEYHIVICILRDVAAEELEKERKERIGNETIEVADKALLAESKKTVDSKEAQKKKKRGLYALFFKNSISSPAKNLFRCSKITYFSSLLYSFTTAVV